jgi:hypothetical protein
MGFSFVELETIGPEVGRLKKARKRYRVSKREPSSFSDVNL